MMKVLVACEFSGRVREAFAVKGHDAWSCDLLETEVEGKHIVGDVLDVLNDGWDMMVAFPPCTHLAASGARWFKDKKELQEEAVMFVFTLLTANIPKIAVENPIGVLSSRLWKPDQIIQPWEYGEPEQKATCLWLEGLPLLRPTNRVSYKFVKETTHKMAPSPTRWKNRSRTFTGIANAMAEQWG